MKPENHNRIISARDQATRTEDRSDSELMAKISFNCEKAITKAEPTIRAYNSASELLAELTCDGSLPADCEYHKAISSALEAVASFIPLNSTLQTLGVINNGLRSLGAEWTKQDIEQSKSQAKAAITTLRHTAKLENALRVQNRLSEASRLNDSDPRLTILGVSMAVMWSSTHEDQQDPDVPGVEFGMVPYVDISLDFLGRPQYNTHQGWVSSMGEASLAKMPGSDWGIFYHGTDTPFFQDGDHTSITFTITYYAGVLHQRAIDVYTRCAHALGKTNKETLTPEQGEVLNSLADDSELAFPTGDPSHVVFRTHDYDQEWVGSLAHLKNLSIQDHAGCYRLEFLSHLVQHVKVPSLPLGYFETVQEHCEVTYPIRR